MLEICCFFGWINILCRVFIKEVFYSNNLLNIFTNKSSQSSALLDFFSFHLEQRLNEIKRTKGNRSRKDVRKGYKLWWISIWLKYQINWNSPNSCSFNFKSKKMAELWIERFHKTFPVFSFAIFPIFPFIKPYSAFF